RADVGSRREVRNRIWGLMAICAASVAFWAAYEQQGNTLALWADADTDRRILGWEFPASWFQALNPLLVFLLTPIVTSLWAWQAGRGKEPSAITKMAIGCFLLSSGFLIMIPAAMIHEANRVPVSFLWLMLFSFMVTTGELYLSPIGLSLVTKLAPARMVSMMMGTWFLSSFVGNYAAGYVGRYWEVMSKDTFFLMMAVVGLVAGLAIITIRRPLLRGIGADTHSPQDL
ncbi:MAG TPA: oligopeptide:H+ symporter, partial [Desulfomonilaceae bacterium]|nr:oligopeptide:H+ symporter [Desulfomonilaceae bacterium]